MIEDPNGAIDYDEAGSGPTIVFLPGSCSTGAAWRPIVAQLGDSYRVVTTSLSGYGRTSERRSARDQSIAPVATGVEKVIERAGGQVHLVGHSWGGLVGLAVALRGRAPLSSLTILEAPALGMLALCREHTHYAAFRAMTESYVAAHERGDPEAIAAVIDFYGGAGTFASWPPPVRAYAEKTTSTNVLDWTSAYAFEPERVALADLALPMTVVAGGVSHPSVVAANRLISEVIPRSTFVTIDGASHFMIATHVEAVARIVAGQVLSAEASHANVRASAD